MELKYFDSRSDLETIRTIWLGLIGEGSSHSFFQSWEWIDCWVKSLAEEKMGTTLAVAFNASIPVCAFFIGQKKRVRNFIIPITSVSINTTNDMYFDDIYIEYNRFLTKPGYQIDYQEIFDALGSPCQWNEIHIPAIEQQIAKQIDSNIRSHDRLTTILEYTSPTFYIDLKSIRDQGNSYIDCVSRNKKRQIKSSLNTYYKLGEIEIRQASSNEEALSFFNSMVELHQKRWDKNGETGAFSNSFLLRFHERMIKSNIDSNCIQLLEISCGATPIGYLYNFLYQNKVYFYQSGFSYRTENKYRPGLISHYLAIVYNLERGYDVYDFLVGDDSYKKSLSTQSTELHWLRIQKKILRFQFENCVKKTVRALIKRKLKP